MTKAKSEFRISKSEMGERPRLVVRKSLRGLTIQIIKDNGNVIVGTWSAKKQALQASEKVVARAIKMGVKKVRFDRGKHRYHGWVKKVADQARKAGLEF